MIMKLFRTIRYLWYKYKCRFTYVRVNSDCNLWISRTGDDYYLDRYIVAGDPQFLPSYPYKSMSWSELRITLKNHYNEYISWDIED